jgi:S-adenosylmethionine/arginine decarboxylase-like enzyme
MLKDKALFSPAAPFTCVLLKSAHIISSWLASEGWEMFHVVTEVASVLISDSHLTCHTFAL